MTKNPEIEMREELMLEKLRDILLREDRASLEDLRDILDNKEKLSERVTPIMEERLEFFKETFPKEFKTIVDRLIEQKLKESQEEILNIIYPVLGKMIKKFINHQFQVLKDSIDAQVKNTFSSQGVFRRIKSSIFGVRDSEIMLSNIKTYEVEEVYVVQRDSGLLMGNASQGKTIDQDVIAGMLTAIKSFVEDAFQREQENLENIEYGNYKIVIQNFHTYYIAVALSGTLSSAEKEALDEKLLDFAEQELADHQSLKEENFTFISEKLQNYFFSDKAVTKN